MYWLRDSDHMAKEGSRFQQCSTCLLILPAFLYFTLPAEYSFISFFKYSNSDTTLFSVICSWGLVGCVCVHVRACVYTHTHAHIYIHMCTKNGEGGGHLPLLLSISLLNYYIIYFISCVVRLYLHIFCKEHIGHVSTETRRVLNFLELEPQMMWALV